MDNVPLPNLRPEAPAYRAMPVMENGLMLININRQDIKKANQRYNNPGAMYPGSIAKKYGSLSFGYLLSDNGKHKIAFFPTPEAGAAANIQNMKNNYSDLSVGAAIRKWRGVDKDGNPNPGSDFVPDGFKSSDSMDEIVYDKERMIDFMKKMAKHEGSNYLSDAQWNKAYDLFSAGGYTPTEGQKKEQTLYALEYAQNPTNDHKEGSTLVQFRRNGGIDDMDSVDPSSMMFSDTPVKSGRRARQDSSTGADRSGLVDRGERSNISVSDSLMSFGTRQFLQRAPETALSQIEGALGPGLSVLAPDVMSSIQTGSGIQSLKDLVSGLSSQDTVTGRISALGAFASENMAFTRAVAPEAEALLPTLPLITEILEASPRDRARLVLENKDALSELLQVEIPSSIANPLTGQDINLLDAMDPEGELVTFLENFVSGVDEARAKRSAITTSSYNDKDGLNVPVQEKKGFFGKTLGMVGNFFGDDTKEGIKDLIPILDEDFIPGESQYDPAVAVLELLKSDDPQKQKEALEFLRSTFPDMIPEEVNLLAATPKEFLELPEVKSKLGDAYNLLNPEETSTKRDIESYIADFISEKTEGSISVAGAKTLAFGGGEKAAKKLQSEVGSVAFEGLIESFPILGQIIEFFIQNQGLLTILGTAGAAAGLSGLAGGGLVGSALAGAGVMATARLALGEEGYNEFRGIAKAGAKPAIDIFRKAFEESGLADMEIIGPAIKGILGFAEENPEATLLGATGNVGAALGSFIATQGIELKDNPGALDDMIKRMEEVNYNLPSYEALGLTVKNSDGGKRNRTPSINPINEREKGETGPASKEIARVTGGMFESRAWANVDSDGGYGWPHNTINS